MLKRVEGARGVSVMDVQKKHERRENSLEEDALLGPLLVAE